ncbi:hypothetical protein [Streptomyces sp. CL12-4]|uniref:hypothetical protein n=1 Tax=Streptomyces sp. CL12-4 TaxID=2810306 RepID=UPI001EFA9A34|nr:hypothetical protein [Streptomyces sp. CL12-4]MCG8971349.1 hypothetical protein [Streptomyces sp. CL12-4]
MSAFSALVALAPSVVFLLLLVVLVMLCAVCLTVLYLSRRVPAENLGETCLGISYMMSAVAGWLPWGKPSVQPALPEPAVSPAEPGPQAVVLVRGGQLLGSGVHNSER